MSYFTDHFGDTYKVIRNYITIEEAARLGNNFKNHIIDTQKTPTLSKDDPNQYDTYQDVEQVALLSEKVSEVNELVGRKVLPAYAFLRQYGLDSELTKHKDRDSCEISLSIHLCADKDWEFCIDDVEGNPVELILHPGDAVLYDACNATHWRKGKYTGEFYIQTFHHYVLLGGKHEHLYFDSTDERRSILPYIKRFENAVSEELCKAIIDYTENNPDQTRWHRQTTEADEDPDQESTVRVCDGFLLGPNDPVDKPLFDFVTAALNLYSDEHPHFNITQDCGYQVLRYREGGKYELHTDQALNYNRQVTIIVNLNDEYEGGELCHFRERISLKLGRGDIVIFPSNFMYPHAISPITSGTRYSVVSWAT